MEGYRSQSGRALCAESLVLAEIACTASALNGTGGSTLRVTAAACDIRGFSVVV